MKSSTNDWNGIPAIGLPEKEISEAGSVSVSPDVSGYEEKSSSTSESCEFCVILPFSEADLLQGLTPYTSHADELITVLNTETG